MAEVNDIAGARLQEGVPEQGFVVLDAEARKKRLARQKEKSTCRYSEADGQTFIGVAHCHLNWLDKRVS
jgi:hypothetical protein